MASALRRSPPKLLESLPSFSPIASRLLALAFQENASMREVSELISADPGLSADVLRLANSPLYARQHEINSLLRAMALLGIEAVRGLVLTVALRNFSRSATQSPVFQQCWRHNLACALVSADLAAAAWKERDAAYTIGLLHDAGRLALLAASPLAYGQLLKAGAGSTSEMLQSERELFEMDHCEVGGWLAEAWQLPPDFHVAMEHHHQPADNPGDKHGYSQIVHLSCELASMAGFQAWGQPPEWNTEALQACLPDAGPSILDAGEFIPRLAAGINSLECMLML
jgi:HD-like signal output (HDOD) protein